MTLLHRTYWAVKRLLHRAADVTRALPKVDGSELSEPASQPDSLLCVVANIREMIPFGPGGSSSQSGHRRFSAGTKVYILAPSWDWMTHGTFECVAMRRRSHRFVRQILDRRFLENWRVQREYSPTMIKRIRRNRLELGWSRSLAEAVVRHESTLAEGHG